MARISGIQRDVIKLYRQCIRAVHKKPVSEQPNFYHFVRREFDKYKGLGKRDFGTIEFLLRKGYRTLEVYSEPSVRNISI